MPQYFSKAKRHPWLAVTICVLLALIAASVIYLSDYYRAAQSVFAQTDGVSVTRCEGGWVVGDTSAETGLVFYPGGKVEATAYLPLLRRIARDEVLCLLVEMPFNLAVLNVKAADGLMAQFPETKRWLIGGHSLGGSMASVYAANHASSVQGVVLLGAYPAKALPEDMPALLIYGSDDGVMNREKYKQSLAMMGTYREVIIEGGNHAGFGDYGRQAGDGEASISPEAQWNQTAEAILTWRLSL